jgi:hypothetical protein
MCKSELKFNFFLSGLWSGVSILLGEGSEENLMLDDLRKELRQDMHLCINNATLPLYAEIQQLKQEN